MFIKTFYFTLEWFPDAFFDFTLVLMVSGFTDSWPRSQHLSIDESCSHCELPSYLSGQKVMCRCIEWSWTFIYLSPLKYNQDQWLKCLVTSVLHARVFWSQRSFDNYAYSWKNCCAFFRMSVSAQNNCSCMQVFWYRHLKFSAVSSESLPGIILIANVAMYKHIIISNGSSYIRECQKNVVFTSVFFSCVPFITDVQIQANVISGLADEASNWRCVSCYIPASCDDSVKF